MNAAQLYDTIASGSTVAPKILSIALMLTAGFLLTRLTKKLSLPNVTAYLVAGILLGPFCLDLIPHSIVEGTDFLPDIALAFIAFGTGEFFRLETLRKNGPGVLLITLSEGLLAVLLVFALTRGVFGLSFSFSLILAVLAAATAPASTMMTIRQLGARGPFVDTLLQVVAMDNIVALVAYSIAVSLASASGAGAPVGILDCLIPVFLNLAVMLIGAVFGLFVMLFMRHRHSTDNRLIIAVTMLFTFCGIASILGVSPLLGCMAMGTVYVNTTGDERLFRQLGYFSPPILMLFFVRSGISFDLGSLWNRSADFGGYSLAVIGVGYFAARLLGKYFGSFLGASLAKKEKTVCTCLGLTLIPQASVAIGLAELGARTLGGAAGRSLRTIILASSILYELIGPAAAKWALTRAGTYPKGGFGADQRTEHPAGQRTDPGAGAGHPEEEDSLTDEVDDI